MEFNYVAEEASLQTIKTAMPSMVEMASFNEGHRYADFNASTDKMAAYGVAGLIGGGLIAKKAGLTGNIASVFEKRLDINPRGNGIWQALYWRAIWQKRKRHHWLIRERATQKLGRF